MTPPRRMPSPWLPLASVVVPLRDPGPDFGPLRCALEEQEAPFAFEILFVDSGSMDGTKARSGEPECVRWIEVPPQTFGHGRTRNLAAVAARGRYIAFLTQDALPADRRWLARHVAWLEARPEVDGAFGEQLPRPGAPVWVRRAVSDHFDLLKRGPEVVGGRSVTDPVFFSNVNACIRRASWQREPFPDVAFAEDQAWARRIVEGGGRIGYNRDAAVLHSHDYTPWQMLRRSVDEGAAMRGIWQQRPVPSVASALRQTLSRIARNDELARVDGAAWPARLRAALLGGTVECAAVVGLYLGGTRKGAAQRIAAALSAATSSSPG